MRPLIAVIAPGAMGAAVGRRLVEGGAEVLTSLSGRSAASTARAEAAGLRAAEDAAIARADFILSIVPPGEALALAERLAGPLAAAPAKAIYVDCNAVSPDTARRISAVIAPTGAGFADAGIIGGPPAAGRPGPRFYASGPAAAAFARLGDYGLEIRTLEGGVGAASALKMAYAGMTKGATAIGIAMLLAATRAGVGEALRAELADSQPQMLARLQRQVPDAYPKAYRWVAEMAEIAHFAAEDPAAAAIYQGIARLYERLADDVAGERALVEALERFLG